MGRAERRKQERANRIESRKGKILISKERLSEEKRKLIDEANKHDVEVLMTCMALAEHRLYGFGKKRVLRSLQYIDDLMGGILDDSHTVEDYKRELEEEVGIRIDG